MTTIALSIVRSPEPGPIERYRAQGPEVTVGRGTSCDWILPDPRRSLSRTHFRLEFLAGAWQVRDLSANGTFLNAEQEPIGRECLRPLRAGDRLRLGDYEIEVSLLQEVAPASHGAHDPSDRFESAPRAGGFAGVRLPGLDDPLSPSAAFAPMQARAPTSNASPFGALADHSPATSDAFMPPPAVAPVGDAATAPDDWFRSMLMPSPKRSVPPPLPDEPFSFDLPERPPAAPAPRAALDTLAQRDHALVVPDTPPRPIDLPPQATHPAAAAPSPGSTLAALTTLMEAAGLAADSLPRAKQDPDKVLQQAGAVLQAAVAGLRALLIARGLVKREFRIEQTVLRPKENNPLKFASSDEHALATLLDPRTAGLHAVQQAIGDLTEHEVAVMTATQAAARAMLEGLSPAALEAEDPGGGMLPGAMEKRLWAAYKRRHATLLAQLEDDFESAFGTAFARAYEQAVNSGGRR